MPAPFGAPVWRPPAPHRRRKPVAVSVLVQRVLHLVGRVADLLLEPAGGLVDLALALEIVVTRQVARRFLDVALGLIEVVTHGVFSLVGRVPGHLPDPPG